MDSNAPNRRESKECFRKSVVYARPSGYVSAARRNEIFTGYVEIQRLDGQKRLVQLEGFLVFRFAAGGGLCGAELAERESVRPLAHVNLK